MTTSVREQLEALAELNRIDQGTRQIDLEISDQQQSLEQLRTDVGRMQELLTREQRQLAEAETLRTTTQREIEDLSERLGRSTARAGSARTSREATASQREVEVLRREREERAARVTELEKVIEQVKASVERHNGEFGELQKHLEEEEAEVAKRLAGLEATKTLQTQARGSVVQRVRADLRAKYDTVRARKGSAVAEVTGGVCRACNIALPPQLFAKLHDGRELFQCPSCQRILYFRPAAPTVTT